MPLTLPGIVAGTVLVFIPSIGQFVVSDLLGGAKSLLAGNLIQNQFAVARNKPFGAAVAFELTAVVLVLLLAYARYAQRQGREALLLSAARAGRRRVARGRRSRRAGTAGGAARRPRRPGLPLPLLPDRGADRLLVQPRAPDGALGGLHPRLVRPARSTTPSSSGRSSNSLLVAGVTTVVATVVGTMAALALARHEFRGRRATQAALFLPIIIPEVVMGAALVGFFGAVGLRLSIWTVVAAHVAFSISYVAIVVRARLAGFDRSLEEAARDLGAGPLATFFRVTLPLILPGIVAAALLVFTLSIDDYVITSFVAGVGATTLPLQIYSMLKVGVTPEVNAVSTLLIVVTVGLIVAAQRLQGAAGGGGGGEGGGERAEADRDATGSPPPSPRRRPAVAGAGRLRRRGRPRRRRRAGPAQRLHLVGLPAAAGGGATSPRGPASPSTSTSTTPTKRCSRSSSRGSPTTTWWCRRTTWCGSSSPSG